MALRLKMDRVRSASVLEKGRRAIHSPPATSAAVRHSPATAAATFGSLDGTGPTPCGRLCAGRSTVGVDRGGVARGDAVERRFGLTHAIAFAMDSSCGAVSPTMIAPSVSSTSCSSIGAFAGAARMSSEPSSRWRATSACHRGCGSSSS